VQQKKEAKKGKRKEERKEGRKERKKEGRKGGREGKWKEGKDGRKRERGKENRVICKTTSSHLPHVCYSPRINGTVEKIFSGIMA
jgi:hypothetical protein